MTDPLGDALIEAISPRLREFVRQEVQRAEWTWRWRSVEQTAELLGISPDAVRTRAARGQLTGHKVEGRLYFDVADLDRLIEES